MLALQRLTAHKLQDKREKFQYVKVRREKIISILSDGRITQQKIIYKEQYYNYPEIPGK